MDPLAKPDFLVNLEKDTFPFEDSTVSEIKAHHILEHIGDGFFHLMKELHRVCENGAVFDIRVPHHRHEIFYGDASHVRPVTVEMLRQFSKKYNNYHIEQFNSSSGFGLRLDVDFEIVEFYFKPDDIWAKRFETMSTEEIEEVSRNFNNVYGETFVKMVAIK
jgi:predicted SAM-dependent methyltransferase